MNKRVTLLPFVLSSLLLTACSSTHNAAANITQVHASTPEEAVNDWAKFTTAQNAKEAWQLLTADTIGPQHQPVNLSEAEIKSHGAVSGQEIDLSFTDQNQLADMLKKGAPYTLPTGKKLTTSSHPDQATVWVSEVENGKTDYDYTFALKKMNGNWKIARIVVKEYQK